MLKQNKELKGVQGSVGRLFAPLPISPNQWTLLSVLVAFAAGAVIAISHDLIIGLCLFAFAAVLDAVDGAVARARGEASAFGGFLDGVADRFVEASLLISLMFYPLPIVFSVDPKIWLALLLFLGACMPSFIRAYADHKGVLKREQANKLGGFFERTERLLVVIIGLFSGILFGMEFFVYAIIIADLFSTVTIVQRLFAIRALAT